MIKCLGCGRRFSEFRDYKAHEENADHPDHGEVYR